MGTWALNLCLLPQGIAEFHETIRSDASRVQERDGTVVEQLEDRLVHPGKFVDAQPHLTRFIAQFLDEGIDRLAEEALDRRILRGGRIEETDIKTRIT